VKELLLFIDESVYTESKIDFGTYLLVKTPVELIKSYKNLIRLKRIRK